MIKNKDSSKESEHDIINSEYMYEEEIAVTTISVLQKLKVILIRVILKTRVQTKVMSLLFVFK